MLYVFSFFNSTQLSKDSSDPILVLRLDDKLGDGVVSTGFLRALKRLNPTRQLIILSGRSTQGLYQGLDFVDQVLSMKKGLLETLRIYKKLKKNNFFWIINTSHILKPREIFLSAKLTAFRKTTFGVLGKEVFNDTIELNFSNEHITERYARVLGVPAAQLSYELKLSPSSLETAAQYMVSDVPVIMLNCFAGARLRNISESKMVELVVSLKKNLNCRIVCTGTESDKETLRVVKLRNDLPIDIPDITKNLEDNIALMKFTDLLISPDTSWIHIASSFKKPVVGIYREDVGSEKNSTIWAPFQTPYRVVWAKDTAEVKQDINNFKVNDVVVGVQELLGLTT